MNNTEILQTLIHVDNLLSDESEWIKEAYERDGCFCLAGAIFKVVNPPGTPLSEAYGALDIFDALNQFIPDAYDDSETSILVWNDKASTKFEDVKNLLKTAIDHYMRS